MSAELVIEIVVFCLAGVAAWLSVKPATPMEWERLWKVILATVIRGEIQASGKDQDEWWNRLSAVPFHPAGRDVYDKLFRPDPESISIPALEGERALVEALASLDSPEARYACMFRESEIAEAALMSNPIELGKAYDPSLPLAPGVDWEAIAAWDVTVQSAIARRLNDVVVALIGMSSAELLDSLPHGSVWEVENPDEESLLALVKESHQRLVIIAKGDEACTALELLHGSPNLRDRLVVFISLGAHLQKDMEQGWLCQHFQHKEFDTELNRRTLYMAISDPGSTLTDSRHQTFPDPPVPPSGWTPIEAVDLGLLPLGQQDPMLFARALWVLLAFCFHSR